jgi:hypothetical protein
MRHFIACLLLAPALLAQGPSLTLYNQNFAVVRERIPLTLQQGSNVVQFTGATAYLEPETVILRDPAGKVALQILEQNYRADPVSQESLLAANEGKELEFLVQHADRTEIIRGRLIRAASASNGQPLVEVDGKLRFQLPGIALFPALPADSILKPTLDWQIHSSAAAKLEAELAYISGGFTWDADYNIVASANGGTTLELIGWVTMVNRSGRTFENASLKLMAGDVNKLEPKDSVVRRGAFATNGGVAGGMISSVAPVTEKTFDEYHLYTLPRPVTLRDQETKQVEFLRISGVNSQLLYIYDGAKIDSQRYMGWQMEAIRQDSGYGTQSNPKVWTMREFKNTKENQLGIPLPKGRARFYRRDSDGRLEFTGEDTINHTPTGETVRVFTGAAFDLTGERRRSNFRIDHGRSMLEESFEIKVRNHKTEAVEVLVVEHLYRWNTWEIYVTSQPFTKTDAQTAEYRVQLQPGEEKTITYAVRYTW